MLNMSLSAFIEHIGESGVISVPSFLTHLAEYCARLRVDYHVTVKYNYELKDKITKWRGVTVG